MLSRPLRLVLCLTFLACRDAAGPTPPALRPAITTDRVAYQPLDPIYVTIRNLTPRLLFDDHCTGSVEGFDGTGHWSASYGMGRACILTDPGEWQTHSVPIVPGQTLADTFFVSSNSYSGTWRVRLGLRDDSGTFLPDSEGISNTFQVRRP